MDLDGRGYHHRRSAGRRGDDTPERWSVERAVAWYDAHPWLRGCNFIPSTAINQLEMWQAETFDPETIDRELGWGAELGFNAMRVYLHDVVWLHDSEGFKERIHRYLDAADRHGIRTIFVPFDDCWHDNPAPGRQPLPRPGVHNSGWVKGPGSRAVRRKKEWPRLEGYVTDILRTFGNDERVILWDIFNEPGNDMLTALGLPAPRRLPVLAGKLGRHYLFPGPTARFLRHAFAWARSAAPTQPLTAALYYLTPALGARLNPLFLELSDVVTFHSYFDGVVTARIVEALALQRRPVICTEYLSRRDGSTFESILPLFRERKIGAINWGLVAGKTQTIYAWDDHYPDGAEPPLWFHDILRADGTPYRREEVETIRTVVNDASRAERS